jgi:hypothetical protein
VHADVGKRFADCWKVARCAGITRERAQDPSFSRDTFNVYQLAVAAIPLGVTECFFGV